MSIWPLCLGLRLIEEFHPLYIRELAQFLIDRIINASALRDGHICYQVPLSRLMLFGDYPKTVDVNLGCCAQWERPQDIAQCTLFMGGIP